MEKNSEAAAATTATAAATAATARKARTTLSLRKVPVHYANVVILVVFCIFRRVFASTGHARLLPQEPRTFGPGTAQPEVAVGQHAALGHGRVFSLKSNRQPAHPTVEHCSGESRGSRQRRIGCPHALGTFVQEVSGLRVPRAIRGRDCGQQPEAHSWRQGRIFATELRCPVRNCGSVRLRTVGCVVCTGCCGGV